MVLDHDHHHRGRGPDSMPSGHDHPHDHSPHVGLGLGHDSIDHDPGHDPSYGLDHDRGLFPTDDLHVGKQKTYITEDGPRISDWC